MASVYTNSENALTRCEYLARRENILLLGNSGTGKAHIALALGLAACQRGHRVRFITAAALVGELIEVQDEERLLRFQKQIATYELLIIDELSHVPLSKTGVELLFETISQRYERNSEEEGRYATLQSPSFPEIPVSALCWLPFTPPQWSPFTPPLTKMIA